ncbi:hypothetical protein GILI108418_15805 [Gillisia limnaea]|uniref:Uncharacterized protein n=1 Tax=Gillisia limnaea (strain DSM 15749 / LMG 21470 / R-8282) TaxID=865937 RepID=H2C0A3_GILLR|nr:hypothetical protein Gilli_2908 [Gillisia limnaea DSM 15749]
MYEKIFMMDVSSVKFIILAYKYIIHVGIPVYEIIFLINVEFLLNFITSYFRQEEGCIGFFMETFVRIL